MTRKSPALVEAEARIKAVKALEEAAKKTAEKSALDAESLEARRRYCNQLEGQVNALKSEQNANKETIAELTVLLAIAEKSQGNLREAMSSAVSLLSPENLRTWSSRVKDFM